MNKRSAMIVAAGLIVALVAGGYALALGVTGPATAAHAQTASQTQSSTTTVTIHKKAPSSRGSGAMSAPAAGQTSGGYSGVSGGSTYNAPVPRVPEPRDGGPDD